MANLVRPLIEKNLKRKKEKKQKQGRIPLIGKCEEVRGLFLC